MIRLSTPKGITFQAIKKQDKMSKQNENDAFFGVHKGMGMSIKDGKELNEYKEQNRMELSYLAWIF